MAPALIEEPETPRQRRGQWLRLALLWLWILAVVLYFAWEASAYRGLFALLAEWQFDRLGQDLPTFNFCLLAMLLAWPALSVLRRRRDDRVAVWQSDEYGAMLTDEQRREAIEDARYFEEARLAVFAAQDYMHFLFGFAMALIVAAVITLLFTLALPRLDDHPTPFSPADISAPAPAEGSAQIRGSVRYGRIASFSRGILFFNRTALYAPILPPREGDGQVRYFVEFLPVERPDISNGALISHRTGILVQSDLPGALVRLYRYLGYHPTPKYFVLYASSATIRWPYYIIAAQFVLGALCFAATGLGQRRHLRHLREEIDDEFYEDEENPLPGGYGAGPQIASMAH